jgi:hypothetical protein
MSVFYSIVFIHCTYPISRRVLGAQQSYSSNAPRNDLSLIDLTDNGKTSIDMKDGISRYQ